MGTLARVLLSLGLIGIAAPVAAAAQSGRAVRVSLDTVGFAAALEVDLKASERVAEGLYYRDLVVGEGLPARRGAEVTVRYAGALADGRVFTQPLEPPATFKLGSGTVIAGWEKGIPGMRVGGLRQLIIAPALGYGGEKTGAIPPNSVLVFEVELLAVR
jgi:peptidylprolyl isomerase